MSEPDYELSLFCIGHLWLFENMSGEAVQVLVEAAMRKKFAGGQPVLIQVVQEHGVKSKKGFEIQFCMHTRS